MFMRTEVPAIKAHVLLRWRFLVMGSAPVLLLAAGCVSKPVPQSQFPSPMEEHIRSHERVDPAVPTGTRSERDLGLTRPVALYVPEGVRDRDSVDVLVHFHGAAHVAESAAEKGGRPKVVAVVNLGAGSSAYERPFADPELFPAVLEAMGRAAAPGKANGKPIRSVTISSWSAGYGAVRAILPFHGDRVDGLLLLDGLHTDYIPDGQRLHDGGRLNTSKLLPFLGLAQRAAVGDACMVVTHSAVFPGTYASTTETAAWLALALGVVVHPVLEWGPVGMQGIGRAEQGQLRILAFAGNTAPDHVDHLHALPALLAETDCGPGRI